MSFRQFKEKSYGDQSYGKFHKKPSNDHGSHDQGYYESNNSYKRGGNSGRGNSRGQRGGAAYANSLTAPSKFHNVKFDTSKEVALPTDNKQINRNSIKAIAKIMLAPFDRKSCANLYQKLVQGKAELNIINDNGVIHYYFTFGAIGKSVSLAYSMQNFGIINSEGEQLVIQARTEYSITLMVKPEELADSEFKEVVESNKQFQELVKCKEQNSDYKITGFDALKLIDSVLESIHEYKTQRKQKKLPNESRPRDELDTRQFELKEHFREEFRGSFNSTFEEEEEDKRSPFSFRDNQQRSRYSSPPRSIIKDVNSTSFKTNNTMGEKMSMLFSSENSESRGQCNIRSSSNNNLFTPPKDDFSSKLEVVKKEVADSYSKLYNEQRHKLNDLAESNRLMSENIRLLSQDNNDLKEEFKKVQIALQNVVLAQQAPQVQNPPQVQNNGNIPAPPPAPQVQNGGNIPAPPPDPQPQNNGGGNPVLPQPQNNGGGNP